MNRVSHNPRVPVAKQLAVNSCGLGVCSLFSASGCLLIPLCLQEMATLKKGDQLKMWEFIRI